MVGASERRQDITSEVAGERLPLIFRLKRTIALLLFALAIPLAVSLVACSGTSDPPKAPSGHATRTYIVTATPTASGTIAVTNPAPATITVTVQ